MLIKIEEILIPFSTPTSPISYELTKDRLKKGEQTEEVIVERIKNIYILMYGIKIVKAAYELNIEEINCSVVLTNLKTIEEMMNSRSVNQ
jgi:hypothetical protein